MRHLAEAGLLPRRNRALLSELARFMVWVEDGWRKEGENDLNEFSGSITTHKQSWRISPNTVPGEQTKTLALDLGSRQGPRLLNLSRRVWWNGLRLLHVEVASKAGHLH